MSALHAPLRRLAAPLLAAALALVPAGCNLGGDEDAPQFVFQFGIAEEAPSAPGTPPIVDVANEGAGIVALQGTFVRTCILGAPRLAYALDGSTITFRATYTPPDGCSGSAATRQMLRYYGYLTRVPAGQYTVRVVHENDELGGSSTVLEETLTVQ